MWLILLFTLPCSNLRCSCPVPHVWGQTPGLQETSVSGADQLFVQNWAYGLERGMYKYIYMHTQINKCVAVSYLLSHLNNICTHAWFLFCSCTHSQSHCPTMQCTKEMVELLTAANKYKCITLCGKKVEEINCKAKYEFIKSWEKQFVLWEHIVWHTQSSNTDCYSYAGSMLNGIGTKTCTPPHWLVYVRLCSSLLCLFFYRLETWDWIWELRETLWLTGRMVSVCCLHNEIPTFSHSLFHLLIMWFILKSIWVCGYIWYW